MAWGSLVARRQAEPVASELRRASPATILLDCIDPGLLLQCSLSLKEHSLLAQSGPNGKVSVRHQPF